MEKEYVYVEATGWEWLCPMCGCLNSMSCNEYEPHFPVTCGACYEEFNSESY